MLAHCDLIAFIATTQPEQAKVFYSEVLELPLMEDTVFCKRKVAHPHISEVGRQRGTA